jgi:hypothetical protein
MIKSIKFKFICFETYLIQEWVKSLKIHLIYILLFNTLSHYRLISKTDSSTSLWRSKLIIFYYIKEITCLSLHISCLYSCWYCCSRWLNIIGYSSSWLLLDIYILISFFMSLFLWSITKCHLVITTWYWVISEIHKTVPSKSRRWWSTIIWTWFIL